jgi:DNA-binding HxlR family transcriptional regulator
MDSISPRTLSARLSFMEEAGLLERHAYAEIPPRVEYSLTEKGCALLPLLQAMRDYGEKWLQPLAKKVVTN